MTQRRVPRWAWLSWIAVGLLLEGIALWTAADGDTLTEVTVVTFPAWLIIGFLSWALLHFKDRYDGQ